MNIPNGRIKYDVPIGDDVYYGDVYYGWFIYGDGNGWIVWSNTS